MKKNSWKILLSVLLMVTMVAGILPGAAFAEEPGGTQDQQIVNENEDGTDTGGDPEQGTPPADGDDGDRGSDSPVLTGSRPVTITVRVFSPSTGAVTVGSDTAGAGKPGQIQSADYKIPPLTNFVDSSKFGSVTKVVGSWYFPSGDQQPGATVQWSTNSSTGTMTYWVDWYNPDGGGSTSNLWNFTLKYDANGGSGAPAEQTWGTNEKYTKSHTFDIPNTTPTREDYTFMGWSDTKDGSATRQPGGTCLVSQTVTGYNGGSVTKTLYAVWEENTPPQPDVPLPVEKLETKIVYDANDGVNPPAAESKQVEKGKTGSFTVKGQENMTNGDLIFKGWNTAANGSGTSYSKGDTAVVEAGKTLTLYAQWDNGQTPPPAPTPDLGKLGITKTASVSTVKPGDNFSYTISVANNTGVDLTHVVVRDVLPAGITYVDSTIPAGVTFIGTTDAPAWTIDSIKNGGTVTITVNVAVAEDAVPGKVTNTAMITHIVAGMSEYGEDQLPGDTADVEIKSGDGGEEAEVPARVIVEFVGLDPADPLPAAYALTGADTNEFLKGAIALGDEEAAAGLRCRTYNTTVKADLGKPYTLKFSQSGFNVPGYNCDAQAEVSGNYSAEPVQDDGGGIEVRIRLTYTRQHLITYPEMSVRIYFKGIDSLPTGFNYTLTGAAANPAAPFIGGPLTLRPGMDNGVPYLQLDGGETTLESGKEYTFSFTQANYNIDGYSCALGVTEFKFTPEMATDIVNPVLFVATNVYTKDGSGDPDWDGLTITKTANRTYSTCGSTLTYKITVTNKTGIELENIKVLDLLDNNLVYHSSGNGFDPDSGMWVISKLANGKSAELTLRARIKRGLSLGTVVTNTAYLTEVTYNNDPVRLDPWLYAEASVTVVKGAPQTGDDSDLGLWLSVMTASLALAGAAAVVFKKRRSS